MPYWLLAKYHKVNIFDIQNIALTLYDYPMSYAELIGTIFGFICVWLAARDNIWTWPTGLVNIACFFAIFYQIGLYSDMFLQLYFLGVAFYGWYNWNQEHRQELPVQKLSKSQIWKISFLTIVFSLLIGFGMTKIHIILPDIFPKPASFAYLDTFIAVASVIANILLARRIIENWLMWIVIDIIAVYVYFKKGVLFISFEYFIYLGIAWYGYKQWMKELKNQ
jgi:nicotinamide mononucleotide transporter